MNEHMNSVNTEQTAVIRTMFQIYWNKNYQYQRGPMAESKPIALKIS